MVSAELGEIQQESLCTESTHTAKEIYSVAATPVNLGGGGDWEYRCPEQTEEKYMEKISKKSV